MFLAPLLSLAACNGGGGGRGKPGGNIVNPAFTNIVLQGRTDVAVGTSPTRTVAADIDGDGKPDLIVARFKDSKVTYFRNLGNGQFAAGVDLPAGPLFPLGVAVAKLDTDTLPDVIVSDYQNDQLYIYRNVGGVLQSPTVLATGQGPISVTVGDFDGDGRADIAVAALKSREVRIHRGGPGFTFPLSTTVGINGDPFDIAATHLDASPRLDLVVTDLEAAKLRRLKNVTLSIGGIPNFSFIESAPLATQGTPIGIATGNLNGTGFPEIVVGVLGSPFVEVWSSDSGTPTLVSGVNVLASSAGVALADVNGDGKLDLIAALPASDAFAIAFGNGDATFQTPIFRTCGASPIFPAAADLNGDGFADTLVGAGDTQELTLQAGAAGAQPGPTTVFAGFSPQFIAAHDLNGDGRPDVVAADSASGEVRFLRNDGGLTLTLVDGSTVQTPSGSARDPLLFDLDKDGLTDVVVLHEGGLTVYRNTGNMVFENAGSLSVDGVLLDGVAVDVNKDGRLDVVATNYVKGTVEVFRNTGTTLVPLTTIDTHGAPVAAEAGDLDNDGDIDIISTDYLANTAQIARRKGNGTFEANAVVLQTSNTPGYVRIGDLNDDGRKDIVVAHAEGGSILTYLNLGKLQFDAPLSTSTAGKPLTTLVTDVNLDGRPDVIYVENSSGLGRARLTQPNGSFGPLSTTFSSQYSTTSAVFIDLDGDDKPEFVTASARSSLLEIHKNLSN